MLFNKTLSSIMRGAFFLEPQTALSYLDVVGSLLEKKKSDFDERPSAVSIRQVFNPLGNVVSPDEEIPEGSIGVVTIMGPMLKYGDWCSYGSDDLVGFAQAFENNPNIIGQIWRMDSGGGTVSAVAPYIDFLEKAQKPVVVLSDMSASANYYIASSTDFIMAENNISSTFGSIGVMVEFADFSKYYKKKGIKLHSVYAEQSDYKNASFIKALEGDYTAIKEEMLNPLAVKFQEHVKAARPNLKLDTPGILSGKMFYAQEALEIGLIDGIGNMDAAIEKVKFLASARSLISSNY